MRDVKAFSHGMRLAPLGHVTRPLSSKKPHEAHDPEPRRPTRLRSVLLVSIVASVVALAMGAAGAIGLWYRAQPPDGPAVHDQPSLQALAGRALTGALDVAEFVRHSASWDLSTVISLLQRTKGREAVTDGDDMQAQGEARPAQAGGRKTERLSTRDRPGWQSRAKEPVSATEIALPTAAPVSMVPTLHLVFDRSDVDVTPLVMQRVRLRSAFRAGLLSQATSEAKTGLVEVVVSVSGKVESAKFVTRPFDVHEAMLLSAVKAWRFRPAMRNGYATRYRLRIPISRVRI